MSYQLLQGDCAEVLKTLDTESIQCCVTSPPYYGLRDYQVSGQIGLEDTPEAYVEKLVAVFREVQRVLKDDGTLWLVIGDSYGGYGGAGGDYNKGGLKEGHPRYKKDRSIGKWSHPKKYAGNDIKPKDLIGIPWMVAFALRADGWYLRSDCIWNKQNPMPESVTDRPTKSHEYIFLLSKSANYFYDADAIREPQAPASLERLKRGWNGNSDRGYPNGPQNHLQNYMGKSNEEVENLKGRNKRTVWTVATKPYKEAHFATFPPDLIEPCVLAGSRVGDVVLDPFNGSGTTGAVSLKNHRCYTGIELNPEYIKLTHKRFSGVQPVLMF